MKILKYLTINIILFLISSTITFANITYKVRRGDSLRKIAREFNTTTADIILTNNLKHPYRIYVGQKLTVPISRKIYRVKRGDNLEKIAKKFGVSTKSIIRTNRLRKPYRIYVGQKLKIPVKQTTSKTKKQLQLQENQERTKTSKYSMIRKVPIYKHYRVRAGDSIGKIAKKFGVSTKSIIRTNRLRKPYRIYVGQKLKILIGYKDRLALNRPIEFIMPLDGQIDTTIRTKGYKGIFITAPPDETVRASEVGIVKFAGKDERMLKKYGNVIILQHPQGYTTIYASLDEIKVKPGQAVHRGEVIGTSGTSGDWRRSGLYFEISRIHNGKAYPLNPLEVLR